MKNTLILDSNTDTGLFHTLLFTLAGHQVTQVRTPAEALNRLLGGGGHPFHLLVISHYSPALPFESFIANLREGGGKMPVLVFRRPENPPESAIPGVIWCSADDALEAIPHAGGNGIPLPAPPDRPPTPDVPPCGLPH